MTDKHHCIDCEEPTDPYMVTDELWKSVIFNLKDCLCLVCLEARMPRRLVLADFPTDKKINNAIFIGALIARREDATNASS